MEQSREKGARVCREKTITHEGDIFSSFDSFSYFSEFRPPDRDGAAFKYLTQGGAGEEDIKFYRNSEPDEYRSAAKPKKEKKDERDPGTA